MRSEIRPPTPAAIGTEAGPESVNAPEGYESLPVLLRSLLGAHETRFHGSAIVRDASGDLLGVLRCSAGQVVAGLVARAADLLDTVIAWCSKGDLIDVAFVSRVDLVGCGSEVKFGPLDILQLTAAVLRTGHHPECVARAVQFVGQRPLILRSNLAVERYGFSAPERTVVEILDDTPHTLAELDREAILPREAVERIVCTLWMTRAITLGPTWLRAVPNSPDDATRSLLPPRSDEGDATLVVTPESKPSGMYSERAPAHAVSELCESPRRSPFPPPSAAPAQAQADLYFEAAEVLLGYGYPREAVLEAQKGMRLCRPRPAQEALYAWALYQRAGAGPKVHDHVWEHLENALRGDPGCELAKMYWALLTAADGGVDRTP